MFRYFVLTIIGLPLVQAAGGWEDFSNNLATDLAPFLSLFGEQVTKQYLSESTSFLDYFIFSMAPMGILTAVVSAIRVCGSPALRAFVGRAQEGAGQAEAELCSSTSQDVCELYQNGGIARVFGRPKILELVYDPDYRGGKICSFREYVQGSKKWSRKVDRSWLKKHGTQSSDSLSSAENAHLPVQVFAPNLSLNIGIKKPHPAVFWAVALGGFILQTGILVFAVIVTYHLQWTNDGNYACPLMIAGTILVCAGMFFCAFLIGQSTEEEVWCRKANDKADDEDNDEDNDEEKDKEKEKKKDNASIHWLQPGRQTIGDQTFDAFYYADDNPKNAMREYTISRKKRNSATAELAVWAAISITMLGFVLQFTGLRGIHSAVAVAQLGAVMVMSLARAAMRMQRLRPEANELANEGEIIIGHELDWLALRLGRQQIQSCLTSQSINPCPQYLSGKTPNTRTRWRFSSAPPTTGRITQDESSSARNPTIVKNLLDRRIELTNFTMPSTIDTSVSVSTGVLDSNMVKVRQTAEHLAVAIESVANVMFNDYANVNGHWKASDNMHWNFGSKIVITQTDKPRGPQMPFPHCEVQDTLSATLTRKLNQPGLGWRTIPEFTIKMEAILGLWVWGLKCDLEALEGSRGEIASRHLPTARGSRCYSIFYTRGYDARITPYLWGVEPMTEENNVQYDLGVPEHADPSTIWWHDKSRDTYVPVKSSVEGVRGDGQFVRLFGWYALPAPLPPIEGLVGTALVESKRPVSSLCAQEILGTFLMSVFEIVEDIGPIRWQKQGGSFRLTNGLIESLVKAYTESGLGTEKDALSCILPAVFSRLETSSLQFAVEGAQHTADIYRREKKWPDARGTLMVVKTTLKEESSPGLDAVTRKQMLTKIVAALCELYRYALWDSTSQDSPSYRFGIDGFRELEFDKQVKQSPPSSQIVQQYEAVRRFDPSSTTDACDGLLSALEAKDLTTTLAELTRLHTPSGSSPDKAIGDALCVAAQLGWAEVVLALLELGADPAYNGFKPCSRSPLSYAAENGSIRTVNYLLDWDADQSAVDSKSIKPIRYAAGAGHIHVVHRLLGITNTTFNPNFIMLAVSLGDTEIVNFLLGTGADMEARGALSRTPLHEAVGKRDMVMVKFLIDKGADTETKDDFGSTPLISAVQDKNLPMVKLLLENGADVNAQDHNQCTPLVWVTRGPKDIVRLLLTHGADTRRKNKHGETVLTTARAWGVKAIVDILEEHDRKQAALGPRRPPTS